MCRSRRELSNAYFFAKFGFDTAENEPSKDPRGYAIELLLAEVPADARRGRGPLRPVPPGERRQGAPGHEAGRGHDEGEAAAAPDYVFVLTPSLNGFFPTSNFLSSLLLIFREQFCENLNNFRCEI